MNYSNNKNTKLILLVVALILIGLGVGLLIFNNYKNKENNTNNKVDNNISENNNSNNTNTPNEDNDSNINNEPIENSGNINIAVLGQTDSVNPILTSAITKLYGNYVTVDTLNSATEITKNGVKYTASTVEYKTTTKSYTHYVFDGFNDVIRGIISGAIKLDGAILVVSADEEINARTREYLRLLQDVGISKIVVYIDKKSDSITDNTVDLREMEIRELIDEHGFDSNTPVIKGSSSKALEGYTAGEKSIKDLISLVDKWIEKRINNSERISNNEFAAKMYLITKDEGGRHTPIFNNYKPQVSINNNKQTGIINLPLGIEMVMPGDYIDITVTLENKVSLRKGEYIKIYESDKLVAVGIITEVQK